MCVRRISAALPRFLQEFTTINGKSMGHGTSFTDASILHRDVPFQGGVILLLGLSLKLIFGHPNPTATLKLPAAFQFGTVFLAVREAGACTTLTATFVLNASSVSGGLCFLALGTAVLFVAVQWYGMWAIIKSISPELEMQDQSPTVSSSCSRAYMPCIL